MSRALSSDSNTQQKEDIAIVGMACLYPGASDLRSFWQNIVEKKDSVGDPPDDWGADLYFDPDSDSNDRIYTKKGGFLGDLARFDPLQHGVMPNSIDGGEPDQFLALEIAHSALTDANYFKHPVAGDRVEIVLGRGTYINRGFTTVIQHGVIVDRVLEILRRLHPEHTEEELQSIKRELKSSLPPFNSEMAPALVPNLVSGRIANRLDFQGVNYIVDAACASSHIAVEHGMEDLRSGKCDVAVVGGVHASTPSPIYMIFCQLSALSPQGKIRPFDRDADGTLLGEGLGILVLKRLREAEEAGDRIYALIKAIGTASDGRGLGILAPRLEGESLALRRAYEQSGIDPHTVGLIEAHGTATPVGDGTEIAALKSVFGERSGGKPWCALGSVKSMIGHCLPASGSAGLIKAALALYHKVLPPTLNCENPNPELGLETAPFYINSETRPWIHGHPLPRRAGVNAFGFGGINAHAILEEYQRPSSSDSVPLLHRPSEVLIVEASSREALATRAREAVDVVSDGSARPLKEHARRFHASLRGAQWRLAIVAKDHADAAEKLRKAAGKIADESSQRIRDRSGIYFFANPLYPKGQVAFLFPGEGSQYENMLSELCVHFPEVRAWFDRIDQAFVDHPRGLLPSQVIFPPPVPSGEPKDRANNDAFWRMDIGPEAIFAANQAIFALLESLQIKPDAIVGHSTGEYSALFAAGANRYEDDEKLLDDILALNRQYEGLAKAGLIAEGHLMTVGGVELDTLSSLICERQDLFLAMDNCPHQQVVCALSSESAEWVKDRLSEKGAVTTCLPFDRAYHTPAFQSFCDRLDEFFDRLTIVPPRVRLYSCMTAEPLPERPEEIRRLATGQWANRVRFRETIERMYADGVRIFVECGPRNNLTSFVDDILRGRPRLATPADVQFQGGITQLNHLIAQLAAHGVPMDLAALYRRPAFEPEGSTPADGARAEEGARVKRQPIKLKMGLQPIALERPGPKEKIPLSSQVPSFVDEPHRTGQLSAFDTAEGGGLPAHKSDPVAWDGPGWVEPMVATSIPSPGDLPLGLAAPDKSQGVLEAYFQTMESFLRFQEEVMATYLGGATGSSAPVQRTLENDVESVPSLGVLQQRTDHSLRTEAVASVDPRIETESSSIRGRGDRAPESAEAERILTNLISEKTGYPIDMLDRSMNLEADLGIDSIKRMEIIGTYLRGGGVTDRAVTEQLSRLKTLGELLTSLPAVVDSSGGSDRQPRTDTDFPMLGRIETIEHGQGLIARVTVDMRDSIYLKDHTIGRSISMHDPELTALPVIPLTFSMELMAEAAAALVPGATVVGMREVRAYRWIALDRGSIDLEVVANRSGNGETVAIYVVVREPTADASRPNPSFVEGTILLAERRPEPPPAAERLRGERSSKWRPEDIYHEIMFHGPRLQAIASMDLWAEDGSEGTFVGLPHDRLFRTTLAPAFETDAITLDAAGQLIGMWTAEHLERGFHVFPFRMEALEIFGPNLLPAEKARCRARIELMGDSEIRSSIEVIGADGCILNRITGWWDKRFDLPERFFHLRRAPADVLLARPWREPLATLSSNDSVSCVVLDDLSFEFLESSGAIWMRVLAYLVLSRRERQEWWQLAGAPRRRIEWVLGRAAAKDAVRDLVKRHRNLALCPADIEIFASASGMPSVAHAWRPEWGPAPHISIAHKHDVAIAIAAYGDVCDGVGIDIEHVTSKPESFLKTAFAQCERAVIAMVGDGSQDEIAIRIWCAKEAVGKAVGRGLPEIVDMIIAQDYDSESGRVRVSLSRNSGPEAEASVDVATVRKGDFVIAAVAV